MPPRMAGGPQSFCRLARRKNGTPPSHCHPDRSNPTFSSHLTSREMVGLRSGGTSLLLPCGGPVCLGGSALPCHPDRSNPIFSSHLTSLEMVGLRSGGTSLLLPPRVPQARFRSLGLGVARSICDPAPTAPAKWAKS